MTEVLRAIQLLELDRPQLRLEISLGQETDDARAIHKCCDASLQR